MCGVFLAQYGKSAAIPMATKKTAEIGKLVGCYWALLSQSISVIFYHFKMCSRIPASWESFRINRQFIFILKASLVFNLFGCPLTGSMLQCYEQQYWTKKLLETCLSLENCPVFVRCMCFIYCHVLNMILFQSGCKLCFTCGLAKQGCQNYLEQK